MKNVLEYLEVSSNIYPDKTAVEDFNHKSSYNQLRNDAKRIGSTLAEYIQPGKPVVVFMEKSVEALTSFMGIVYAGCFYIFISPEQPASRIRQILTVAEADTVITLGGETSNDLFGLEMKQLDYYQIVKHEIAGERLQQIREQALDIDPLYCNFTSGSTGVPKGVLVSHRSVIDFMEYFPDLFHITKDDVIGNQAPFDFDVSVKDIFSAFKVSATLVIIPKKLFSIITQLLDYICDRKITTMIWAVSALCLITQLRGLTYRVPTAVNKILFSGEAMPVKHLKQWKKYLPDALYVNLYGPTEITCNCTYYRIEREFDDSEKLPIGKPFPNEKVFLLDENDKEITAASTIGELCVSGTALALGYYNNTEQTQKAFVQNPLNKRYLEPIYRTGDLAFYNEDGDFCFAGRKDFQIKFMGHRIELEEIDVILNSLPEIQRACTVFDSEKNCITAFYVGDTEKKQIQMMMKETTPAYMIPTVFYQMTELPVTSNGKIDRKKLLELCGKGC